MTDDDDDGGDEERVLYLKTNIHKINLGFVGPCIFTHSNELTS